MFLFANIPEALYDRGPLKHYCSYYIIAIILL